MTQATAAEMRSKSLMLECVALDLEAAGITATFSRHASALYRLNATPYELGLPLTTLE